jgi:hypothetical protein
MPRIKERFARLTTRKMVGTSDWMGVSTMGSGTTVISVSAAQATSGSIIIISPLGLATAQNTGGFDLVATSLAAGSFLIVSQGSYAPPQPMTVGWVIFNQSR